MNINNRAGQSLVIAAVGALMITYVLIGGMKGTTYVQIIKAVLLITGAALMSVWVLAKYGMNFSELLGDGAAAGALLEPGAKYGLSGTTKLDFISLALALVLGTAGLPHILMRFYTVPTAKEARKSVVWAIWLIGLFYLFTLTLGYGAAALVGPEKIAAAPGAANSAAPLLAYELGGTLLLGVISAVAFATILAVVAGLTITASASFAHDIYASVIHKGNAPPGAEVRVARIAAVVVGVVAILGGIAANGQNIAFLVALAFAVAASANLPTILYSLFWKRFNTRGCLWSIYGGLTLTVTLIAFSPAVSGNETCDVPGRGLVLVPAVQPGDRLHTRLLPARVPRHHHQQGAPGEQGVRDGGSLAHRGRRRGQGPRPLTRTDPVACQMVHGHRRVRRRSSRVEGVEAVLRESRQPGRGNRPVDPVLRVACPGVPATVGRIGAVAEELRRRLARPRSDQLAPNLRGGRRRVQRVAGHLSQQVRPRSWHHVIDRVAAAADRDPAAAAHLVHQLVQRRVAARCPSTVSSSWARGSSRWVSQPSWVTTILRLEGSHQRRHHGVERPQPATVTGMRGQRDVDRTTLRVDPTHVLREAGARKGRVTGLVQADRQHPRVVVKRRFDPVPVMGVHIDISHSTYAIPQKPRDGDGRVVVDAEPRRPGRHRVMKAASQVDGVVHLAATNRARRLHGGPGDERRRIVHQLEDRVVLAAQSICVERLGELSQRRPPHRRDVRRVMHERQHLVGSGLGGNDPQVGPRQHAQVASQSNSHLKPARVHRVGASQVVLHQVLVPHKEDRRAHDRSRPSTPVTATTWFRMCATSIPTRVAGGAAACRFGVPVRSSWPATTDQEGIVVSAQTARPSDGHCPVRRSLRTTVTTPRSTARFTSVALLQTDQRGVVFAWCRKPQVPPIQRGGSLTRESEMTDDANLVKSADELEKVLKDLLQVEEFEPPPQFRERARIRDPAVYAEAERDPEGCWAERARELHWHRPFTTVLDESEPAVLQVVRRRRR